VTSIRFEVPLVPHAQARPRAVTVAGHAAVYKPSQDRRHEADLAAIAAQHRPSAVLCGPLQIEIVAVMPRPASLCGRSKRDGRPLQDPARRFHASRPDADNLAKTVLDALRAWWRDDAQVADLRVVKQIAALDELPHYAITVCELAGERD
jgi:Holliday junction resolvase RusA-like endonuclease